MHKNQWCHIYTLLAFAIIGSIVAVVVVHATKRTKQDNGANQAVEYVHASPTQSPTPAPTTSCVPKIKEKIETDVLQRNATFENMTKTDPRILALHWNLHNDRMHAELSDVNLSQRYILALLSFLLDSLAWRNCGEYTPQSEDSDKNMSLINALLQLMKQNQPMSILLG